MAKEAAKMTATATATIRRYADTAGGCTLIRAARPGGPHSAILVGFGAPAQQADAAETLRAVADDVIATTGGHVDLVLIPAPRWTYLAGFRLAANKLLGAGAPKNAKKLRIAALWLPEEARNADARAVHEQELADLLQQVRAAEVAEAEADALLRAKPIRTGEELADSHTAQLLATAVAHCGPELGAVDAALDKAAACATESPRYCCTHSAAAAAIPNGPTVSIVAGKPHVHDHQAMHFATARLDPVTQAPSQPFDSEFRIDIERARQMPFFQQHYWADRNGGRDGEDQSWRRIDSQWMRFAPALTMEMEETASAADLVFAIQLGEHGPTLLTAEGGEGVDLSNEVTLATIRASARTELYTEYEVVP